jgi:hypothetical protein
MTKDCHQALCKAMAEIQTEPVDSPAGITSIVFPTCDRVASLQGCMTSFITNQIRYQRTSDYVVMDDSSDLKTGNDYCQMLKALHHEFGVPLSYGGMKEKILFAKRLMENSEVPTEVIKFALFDVDQFGVSTLGANRNAILLHTAGELVLSSDDDVRGPLATCDEMKKGISLTPGYSPPEEFRIVTDRETAKKKAHVIDTDILAAQEKFLGKTIPECCMNNERKGELNFEKADTQILFKLLSHGNKILVTTNGYFGDNGWGSPSAYLSLTGESFRQMTQSESTYRAACTSREMLQFVKQVTLTDRADNMMAGCLGIDNRDLVPPFLPVGRGEDHLFGTILSKCFRKACFAFLPHLLLHAPVESRNFWPGEITRRASGLDLHTLFQVLIASHVFPPDEFTDKQNLQRLGKYLEELGQLDQSDFEIFVRQLVGKHVTESIATFENRLQEGSDTPAFWANDVRKYILMMRDSLTKQEWNIPLELLYGRNITETRKLTQKLVFKYGQLLFWWPSLVEAARHLRSRNERLAQGIV